MRLPLAYSLVLYGLLLGSTMVICPVPNAETIRGTLDFKAAIARQYPKGATPKKEVEVPTEGALNLPLEEQPNLLDVKKPGAHLTEEQKAEEVRQARLAEGRTYGPGGRGAAFVWKWMKKGWTPFGWLFRKLVERFDNHVSKEELNTLKKAKEAQLLPPDLFPASSSDPIMPPMPKILLILILNKIHLTSHPNTLPTLMPLLAPLPFTSNLIIIIQPQ
ncbi:hypothetical protein PSHT_11382 [Puccinia striiformis]|uniref:Uncharacterized protein n=1 Tax=Puccinia striiformis TaxID=27350 RepID=A0A2S4V3N7_9BASI|nr:hypothetical protein PSHT_11382 [Puccinia striiformis]